MANRRELVEKALHAQYALLAYNLAEAALSIFFGAAASSIALVSFGLDSLVESLSTITVALRLRKSGKVSAEEEERHEKNALRLVGYSFIVLGAYVLFEAARKLIAQEQPEASLPGIAIAAASVIFMTFFANYRHGLGHSIGSHSLVADSRQTQLCVYMSYSLLAGIGLNFLFGLWWADPLAGIAIACLALWEGKRALEGESCC